MIGDLKSQFRGFDQNRHTDREKRTFNLSHLRVPIVCCVLRCITRRRTLVTLRRVVFNIHDTYMLKIYVHKIHIRLHVIYVYLHCERRTCSWKDGPTTTTTTASTTPHPPLGSRGCCRFACDIIIVRHGRKDPFNVVCCVYVFYHTVPVSIGLSLFLSLSK